MTNNEISNTVKSLRTDVTTNSDNIESVRTDITTINTALVTLQENIDNIDASGGAGDMEKTTYDTDNDGIVDDASALASQSPSYYLDLDNHIFGSIPQSQVTDLTTDLADKMNKSVYDIGDSGIVDMSHDSEMLDGKASSFYQDPAETDVTIGALINGATSKTTPVDADYIGLMDSAASNVLKKLSWANLKATIKTYYDSLATTLTNKTIAGGSNTISGITEAMQTIADNTTNNVSTSAHGYAPKGDGSVFKYLNANGAYSVVYGTITWGALSFNPADSTTYYTGWTNIGAPTTTESLRRIYFTTAKTIRAVGINLYATAGGTETMTAVLRINASSDPITIFTNQVLATGNNFFSVTGCTQAMAAGEWCEIKITVNAAGSNPTGVLAVGWIEYS